jgi:hypothetical protein
MIQEATHAAKMEKARDSLRETLFEKSTSSLRAHSSTAAQTKRLLTPLPAARRARNPM